VNIGDAGAGQTVDSVQATAALVLRAGLTMPCQATFDLSTMRRRRVWSVLRFRQAM